MLSRAEWVKSYADDARQATAGSGIFPELLLSQAIIESSGKGPDGNFYPGMSQLSRNAFNYFGIKANGNWRGPTYSISTREYVNGQYITVYAKFRKYNSVRDSFADYVKFLKVNPRYTSAGVFTATTPEQQAERVAAAGYATSPTYASLVKSVIKSVKSYLPPIGTALGLLIPAAIVFFLIFRKK